MTPPSVSDLLRALPRHRTELFEARLKGWHPDLRAALDLLYVDAEAVADHASYPTEPAVTCPHLMPLVAPRSGPNDGGHAVADHRVDPRLGTVEDLSADRDAAGVRHQPAHRPDPQPRRPGASLGREGPCGRRADAAPLGAGR